MIRILPLLALLPSFVLSAQELTLDSAIAMTLRHERYDGSRALLVDMKALQNNEVNSAWLPQLTLNAQSTVQNEQFGFPAAIPGLSVPAVPLDFHRVLVNFSQTVYDGQVTRSRLQLEQLDLDQQDLLFAGRELEVRGQVTQRYMAVLLSEAQLRLLDLRSGTITGQRDRISAAVDAGAALPSDADALDAELIAVEQERVQVRYTVERIRQELAVLTGESRVATIPFAAPAIAPISAASVDQRPDIRAFDLRLRALDVQGDLARSTRLPKLKIFGNAGAGDPGYNSFRDEWRPMLLIGAGLEWRILDWGTRKRTDRMLDMQRELVHQDRDRLAEQWTMAVEQQRKNMQQFGELTSTDERLVKLRSQVSQAKSEQLANGTITTSEYITELNKEHAARLGSEVHHLQAVLAARTAQDLQAR